MPNSLFIAFGPDSAVEIFAVGGSLLPTQVRLIALINLINFPFVLHPRRKNVRHVLGWTGQMYFIVNRGSKTVIIIKFGFSNFMSFYGASGCLDTPRRPLNMLNRMGIAFYTSKYTLWALMQHNFQCVVEKLYDTDYCYHNFWGLSACSGKSSSSWKSAVYFWWGA